MKKNKARKQLKRWLKALEIAKILFEEEWYHTRYLEEIEQFIKKRRRHVQPKDKRGLYPKIVSVEKAKANPNDQTGQ